MTNTISYRHDLGKGLYLDAFSLTSEIDSNKLQGIVSSIDGKANQDLEALSKTVIQTDQVGSIKDLKLEPREGNYQVPAPLKPYRDAIQKDWDSKGRFNGPVIIATGDIKVPIRVIQGGYYDFAATKLADQPAKLVPDVYREGQTVEDVLNEHGVSIEERAKYFGFAHMMWPLDGKEFLLVQRAKGMGIAGDCISTPGSTPDLVLNKPGLKKSGFGIDEYWSYHFAEEMKDEFHLLWGDFWIGDIPLFEDKRMIPFGAVNIHTQLSAKEIAEKAYGDPRVLKEHTVLYSMTPETISTFLQRFPVFPNIATVIDRITKAM